LALFGLFTVPDDSPDDSTLQKAGFWGASPENEPQTVKGFNRLNART
jgi:hypothetical protein